MLNLPSHPSHSLLTSPPASEERNLFELINESLRSPAALWIFARLLFAPGQVAHSWFVRIFPAVFVVIYNKIGPKLAALSQCRAVDLISAVEPFFFASVLLGGNALLKDTATVTSEGG